MNNVVLVGRMVKDPEVRYTSGENSNAYTLFTVAVNRSFKNAAGEYDADFISCKAFGKTAELVGKFFTKGKLIGINGEIRTDNYTNKEGVKVYTTDVFCNRVEFVGGKNESGGGDGGMNNGARRPVDTSFMNIPDGVDEDEGLPF